MNLLKKIFLFASVFIVCVWVIYYFDLVQISLGKILSLNQQKHLNYLYLLLFFTPVIWSIVISVFILFYVWLFRFQIYETLEFTVAAHYFCWSRDTVPCLWSNLVISLFLGLLTSLLQQSLILGLFIACIGSLIFSFTLTLKIFKDTYAHWNEY